MCKITNINNYCIEIVQIVYNYDIENPPMRRITYKNKQYNKLFQSFYNFNIENLSILETYKN